jgi:hypothetical protein
VDVGLPSCECEESYELVMNGDLSASNGDLNYDNNTDTVAYTISSDEQCVCEPYYPQFDYNDDNSLNDDDRTILQNYILGFSGYPGSTPLESCEIDYPDKECDPSGDGNLSTMDLIYLTQVMLGDIDI